MKSCLKYRKLPFNQSRTYEFTKSNEILKFIITNLSDLFANIFQPTTTKS